MMLQSDSVYIGRLRARGDGRDALSMRWSVEQSLAAIRLRPARLSPHAILCIRRFRVPLPGRSLHRPWDPRLLRDWEEAATTALDEIARHAARPALAHVPAGADAVLFLDRAEWLACLAKDWSAGTLTTHWWWQTICRGGDLLALIVASWQAAPEYVPAAFELLARADRVIPFLRAIPDRQATVLRQDLMKRFALTALEDALRNEARETILPSIANPTTKAALETVMESELAQTTTAIAQQPSVHVAIDLPWRRWISEMSGTALSWEQEYLLGIGLMLHRAPAIIRSQQFAEQFHEARRISAPRQSEPENSAPPCSTADGARSAGSAVHDPNEGKRIWNAVDPDYNTRQVQRSELSANLTKSSADVQQILSDIATSNTAEDAFVPSERPSADTGLAVQKLDLACASVRLETELGGVFYLVNLGLALGLYNDFTLPATPGINLSIWDFLRLISKAMLKDAFETDGVWELLADLAGRDCDDPLGSSFEPADDWRIPATWLDPFPEPGAWYWSNDSQRLRVTHEQGFLLCDVARDDRPVEDQLLSEINALGSCDALIEGHSDSGAMADWAKAQLNCGSPLSPKAGRWFAWVFPYIRVRLCRALGLGEDDDLATVLLRHPAKLEITSTHLDIWFALAELPIAIRLSGLDRDPGWVPAAGRFIAFHFD